MYGNLEARDENQRTPLHLACQYGHIEIVQHFIQELKCDPEPKDKYGYTPLQLASLHGQVNIVQYFAQEKVCKLNEDDARTSTMRETVIGELYQLYKACKSGDSAMISRTSTMSCVE